MERITITNHLVVMIPPFYVGQRVVAIRDGKCGRVKRGEEFTILSIIPSNCKCKMWVVDIGLTNPFGSYCGTCGQHDIDSPIVYKDANIFAPIIENFESIKLTKILEKELASVN